MIHVYSGHICLSLLISKIRTQLLLERVNVANVFLTAKADIRLLEVQ